MVDEALVLRADSTRKAACCGACPAASHPLARRRKESRSLRQLRRDASPPRRPACTLVRRHKWQHMLRPRAPGAAVGALPSMCHYFNKWAKSLAGMLAMTRGCEEPSRPNNS